MAFSSLIKTSLATILALTAFAANSVLCRMALGSGAVDAASFTIIRLVSGSLMLIALMFFTAMYRQRNDQDRKDNKDRGSWFSAFMLFIYATGFSFSYLSLDTATGALVLFTAVQVTMITNTIILGYRLKVAEWFGLIIAFMGFVLLILPGIQSPPMMGTMLMVLAGVSWGLYSIRGHGSVNALFDTGYNFIRSLAFIIPILMFGFRSFEFTNEGILLALASGAITSGLGYTIWYVAIKGLSSVQAGVLQLLVPAITALGGVVFLAEPITYRLSISMSLITGGVLLVILNKRSS